jgi:class 3 adenylate cyclase
MVSAVQRLTLDLSDPKPPTQKPDEADKYLGDGPMAVFGQNAGAAAGCRQAIMAAKDIDLARDKVNAELGPELG